MGLEKIQHIIKYIEEHYHQNISVQKLEHISNYSYRNVQRVFKAVFKELLGAFQKILKLENAEIDGNGTLLATKSAILNNNRNPNMTQAQAEVIFTKYLGVTKFIWLKGKAGLEITDMHIDGFARFGNTTKLYKVSILIGP